MARGPVDTESHDTWAVRGLIWSMVSSMYRMRTSSWLDEDRTFCLRARVIRKHQI
jgi:hypothetical protein